MMAHTNAVTDDALAAISPELLIEMYRKMVLIRQHEELCIQLKAAGLAKGPVHLCIGQEAAGVGVGAALRQDDIITSTHRGHAHFLGKGADPNRLLAEILGKRTGYGKGKSGHMLIADIEHGVVAGSGIVGGFMAVAAGEALAFQMQQTDRVVVCYFGEGGANEGAFNEALNFAALWKLPVIYVCENNLYGLTVPVAEQLSIESVATRAIGYGMPGESVDGNDVVAVYQVTQKAVARARAGGGPSLIEACTYRTVGFSTGDTGGYRSDDEIQAWRERDPIPRLAAQLERAGVVSADQLAAVQADVKATIEAAHRYAMDSPFPEPSEVLDDLWA